MRIKALNRYSERYWDLIRQAQDKPVFISQSSTREARNLRNDLYNFRAQLRARAEQDENYEWARELADSLSFKISRRGGEAVLIVGRAPNLSDTIPIKEEEVND